MFKYFVSFHASSDKREMMSLATANCIITRDAPIDSKAIRDIESSIAEDFKRNHHQDPLDRAMSGGGNWKVVLIFFQRLEN